MKLLTKELREKLLANGREQAEVKGTKAEKTSRQSSNSSTLPETRPGF